MSLNKAKLKLDIKSLLEDMLTREENSIDELATRLSNSIDVFVKSGKVVVNSGINVSTTGGSGSTTSKGSGKIV